MSFYKWEPCRQFSKTYAIFNEFAQKIVKLAEIFLALAEIFSEPVQKNVKPA